MRGAAGSVRRAEPGVPAAIRQAGSVSTSPSTNTWPARHSARACSQEVPGASWRTSAASVGGPGARGGWDGGAGDREPRGFFGRLDTQPFIVRFRCGWRAAERVRDRAHKEDGRTMTPHRHHGAVRREVRASVQLALPVVAVQVGLMLMGTVDTAMLGHFSARALAAGAIGHIISFTLLMFGAGLLAALDPLITQAFGAGRHDAVGAHMRRGLVLATVIAVPISLAMVNLAPLLRRMGEPSGVVVDATLYARYLIAGTLPYLLFLVLRQTLQAMSVVAPALRAIVAANLVNALTNYALIFGHWGLPSLGAAGSACATAAARWIMFFWLLAEARRPLGRLFDRPAPLTPAGPEAAPPPPASPRAEPPARQRFRDAAAGRAAREPAALRHYTLLLRIGLPIAAHNTLELSLFMVAGLLIGRFGTAPLAGHQIALLLASLSFMLPLGISGAATTRVGNAIGRGDMPGARRTAAVCLGLGAGVMTLFAAAFALAPHALAAIFTDDPEVIAAAASLLPIAALFQVLDGTQVVSAGILRGGADTAFPAVSALAGYWLLGLPLGYWMAFHLGFRSRGLWWGITVGLAVVATLLVARIAFRFRGHISRVAM
jgi:MATE family multidrug resistance protein